MKFHNIELNNIENGTGIRVLLWVSGCFHNCKGCQNPITHDPNDGIEFDENSMKEIIDGLEPSWVSGITFTGGDPLCFYYKETLDIIKKIREVYGNKKTIWLYTGYTVSQLIGIALDKNKDAKKASIFMEILKSIDVLCDGKWMPDRASKEYHWVGSTNQRVVNMKKSIEKGYLVFLEESERKNCSIDSTETDKKLSQFSYIVKYNIH